MNTDFSLPVDSEILLKLPTLTHAEELFALVERNRQFLREYLPWVDHNVSVKDSIAFIEESRQNFDKSQGFSVLILYKGKIAGTIGLHYIDTVNKRTEIGYWISQEHQGKGIMHKSCLSIIDYAFKTLKLHRVEIRCAVNNRASQRIPEKLGFAKEAVLRESTLLNGEFLDTIIYGLLSQD
jgi:ribosomal-protein-serine acetyltransferase